MVDRHEVRRGSVIDECIIIGGTITPALYDSGANKLFEKTVDVLENGELQLISIDWVPKGPIVCRPLPFFPLNLRQLLRFYEINHYWGRLYRPDNRRLLC